MIYLDNAATSFPKPERVYREMDRCMREYCANPGRGGHIMSNKAGEAVMKARETICSFFNFSNPLQMCFTKNATEALNIAIKGSLLQGDNVITTSMEHNSVIRPLKTLERDGVISLTIVRANEFGEISAESIKELITPSTKLIACTLSSNVNGSIMPFKEIGEAARKAGVLFLLDASQGAGTIKIDMEEMFIDMLAFPGHKCLLGPQGTGALLVREGIMLKPILQGGTGSNSENMFQPDFMPDALESGTINTPGIIGLGYGIDFINSCGRDSIKQYKNFLFERLYNGVSDISCIRIYSRPVNNSGVFAINIAELDSNEVCYILDRRYGIETRAGLHCAPMAHETIGTLGRGVVRFSVGCFNTIEEIDQTIKAINEIANKYLN